jgi:hypothetical protein
MPIDPCGYGMDWLNGGFLERMHPYIDRPEEYAIVRWYPCAEGVPFYPGPQCFPSSIYGPQPWETPFPGAEWERPRTKIPAVVNPFARGSLTCGTPEEFRDGVVFDADWIPPPRRSDGLPACCGQIVDPRGGGMAGGAPDWIPPAIPVIPGGLTCPFADLVPDPGAWQCHHTFGGLNFNWFLLDGPPLGGPGGRVHLRSAPVGGSANVYGGASCFTLTFTGSATVGSPVAFAPDAAGFWRVAIFPGAPTGNYTFEVTIP